MREELNKAKTDRKKLTAEQQYYNGVELESSDSEDMSKSDNSLDVEWAFTFYHDDTVQKYTKDDILLDMESTVSVFKNRDILTHVQKAKKKLRTFTNVGWQDSTQVGMVPCFFPVWFNEESRLNFFFLC